MKLSKREKIMLAFLLILALSGAYYFYLLQPQLVKMDELKKQTAVYQTKLSQIQAMASDKNPIYNDFTVMESKVKNSTALFFPSINQEKIITILETKLSEADIQPQSIIFSNAEAIQSAEDISETTTTINILKDVVAAYTDSKIGEKKAAVEPGVDKKATDSILGSVEALNVTINYNTSYESLVKLIKGLESLNRRIIIDNIICTKGENDLLQGSLTVSFYAVPKLIPQDETYLQWDYNNLYGKDNPFSPISGYTNPLNNNGIVNANSKSADFFLSVKSIASDIPTVIIGKKDDKTTKTFIYADNADFENVEIQLIQKDNKYYYRYKTQREKYPADYDDMTEFIPNGNTIVIETVSSKRAGKEDLSGANITLLNMTRLKTVVNVIFDDKSNNRVKFIKTSGDVVVNRSMEE